VAGASGAVSSPAAAAMARWTGAAARGWCGGGRNAAAFYSTRARG
jgi:hypothetical protein